MMEYAFDWMHLSLLVLIACVVIGSIRSYSHSLSPERILEREMERKRSVDRLQQRLEEDRRRKQTTSEKKKPTIPKSTPKTQPLIRPQFPRHKWVRIIIQCCLKMY